jgi:hypothetical protein
MTSYYDNIVNRTRFYILYIYIIYTIISLRHYILYYIYGDLVLVYIISLRHYILETAGKQPTGCRRAARLGIPTMLK